MKIEVLEIGGGLILVGDNHMTAEQEKDLTNAQALASMHKFGLAATPENIPEYFKRLNISIERGRK